MAMFEIHQIPTRKDNYVWLIKEPESGETAVVDPSDAPPVIEKLEELGWTLDKVLVTHHHNDHTGGIPELKERYGCTVIGPGHDRERIPTIDVPVRDGDEASVGVETAKVFETPGHTLSHISYWFPNCKALFCGDTLFALGCGRVFEGTMEMMWTSLSKYGALPDDTRVFCAHEYTQANAKFALSVDGGNDALVKRSAEIDRLRAAGKSTVPSTMGEERETNPFLRPALEAFRAELGMKDAEPWEVFGEVRTRKDNF